MYVLGCGTNGSTVRFQADARFQQKKYPEVAGLVSDFSREDNIELSHRCLVSAERLSKSCELEIKGQKRCFYETGQQVSEVIKEFVKELPSSYQYFLEKLLGLSRRK